MNIGTEQHYILNELHYHLLQASELEAGTWETFCYTFIVYIPHTFRNSLLMKLSLQASRTKLISHDHKGKKVGN